MVNKDFDLEVCADALKIQNFCIERQNYKVSNAALILDYRQYVFRNIFTIKNFTTSSQFRILLKLLVAHHYRRQRSGSTNLPMTVDNILSDILATITILLSKPEAASDLHQLGTTSLLGQSNADSICTFVNERVGSVWVVNRRVDVHLAAMRILAFTRCIIMKYWRKVVDDGELSFKQINRHVQGHMLCIIYDESGVYMSISRPGKVFPQLSLYLSCRIKKNHLKRLPSHIHG